MTGVTSSQFVTARALAHQALLEEIIPALRERGIRPLLIKGFATIRLLYPNDPHMRDADDVDLFVSHGDFAAAEALLAERGFRHKLDGARPDELDLATPAERTWLRDGPLPCAVDLHRALPLAPHSTVLFELLARDAQVLEIGATSVEVPSDAATTLIVALHAVQHGPKLPKPLADLKRALIQMPDSTWQQAAELAAELGVRGELRVGLEMLPEGRALLERLSVDEQAPIYARVYTGGAKRLIALAQTRDTRSALRLLWDSLFPSRAILATNPNRYVGPGWQGLTGAYARRFLLIPRSVALVLTELARPHLTRVSASLPASLLRYLRTLSWAERSVRSVRGQLETGTLESVTIAPAPLGGRGATRGLRHGLRLSRPSCLERSLVRRAWHLRQGRDRPIVIGVRGGGGDAFGAHAWLQGDPPDPLDFAELLVWPRPER